jgi:hypothetical protein
MEWFQNIINIVTTFALRYIGMEHVMTPRWSRDTDNLLLRRELYWIHCLCTMSPRGLNQEFDVRPFLA